MGVLVCKEGRVRPVGGALLVGDRQVRLGQDPLRGALEEADLLGPVDDGRDDLDGCGPGADDADALSLQGDRVVPAGGVEGRAGESLQALDVRE